MNFDVDVCSKLWIKMLACVLSTSKVCWKTVISHWLTIVLYCITTNVTLFSKDTLHILKLKLTILKRQIGYSRISVICVCSFNIRNSFFFYRSILIWNDDNLQEYQGAHNFCVLYFKYYHAFMPVSLPALCSCKYDNLHYIPELP